MDEKKFDDIWFNNEMSRAEDEFLRQHNGLNKAFQFFGEDQVFSDFFVSLIDEMVKRKDFNVTLGGGRQGQTKVGYPELQDHIESSKLSPCESFVFSLEPMLSGWQPWRNEYTKSLGTLMSNNLEHLERLCGGEIIDPQLVEVIATLNEWLRWWPISDFDLRILTSKRMELESQSENLLVYNFYRLLDNPLGLIGGDHTLTNAKVFYIQIVLRLLCALDIATKIGRGQGSKAELESLAEYNTPIFPYITVDESSIAESGTNHAEILFAVHGMWTAPVSKCIQGNLMEDPSSLIFNKMLFTVK